MAVSPRLSYFWKITPYALKRHRVKGCFCKVYRRVHAHSCIMGNQGKMARNSKISFEIQSQLLLPEFIYLTLFMWKEYLTSSKKLNLECKEVRDQFLENFNFFHTFSVILILSNYRKCMGISWISWNIVEYLFTVSNFKHPTCPVFQLHI